MIPSQIFDRGWGTGCFNGAWTNGLGARSPSFMVASQTSIDDNEATVGLFVHEFLHNLGVGHTQKRPGKYDQSALESFNI